MRKTSDHRLQTIDFMKARKWGRRMALFIIHYYLFISPAGAQDRKWHFEMDLRYQHMFLEQTRSHYKHSHYDPVTQLTTTEKLTTSSHSFITDEFFPSKYGGNTLVLMETYAAARWLTVGLGMEYANYHQTDLSGLNFMATLRLKPWRQHPYSYVYTEVGLGPLLNVGWGTSVKIGKRRRLSFKVGYDMQADGGKGWDWLTIDGFDRYYDNKFRTYRHCLQVGIGVVF